MTESGPEIVHTENGLAVRYRGRFLYNRKAPRESAVRRTLSAKLQEKTLVFFPSPLLFYGVPELLNHLPDDCHILCVETDQNLMKLSLDYIPGELRGSPNVSILRTESTDELASYLKTLGIRRFRRARLVTAGGGYRLDAETYKRLFDRVQEEIRQFWQNRMTSIHMGHLWLKNLLNNLMEGIAVPPIQFNTPVSKPVCVIGAGESLEHSVPLLKELRKEFYLLSVDTALPVLEAHEITPDGVCVMESQFANSYDFIGAKSRDAAGFLDLTSYPPLYRFFTGEKRIFCSRFGGNKLISRLEEAGMLPESVPPLGSVGVTGLYIACRLNTFPVFMTGLDFSYTLGKPHARGAPSHTLLLSRCNRMSPPLAYAETAARPIVTTEGKTPLGPAVTTDLVLLSYAESFRTLIRREQRIYELGTANLPPFGIANGAARVSSAAEVRNIIAEHRVTEETDADMPKNERVGGSEYLRAFLQKEKTLLQSCIQGGKHYITTSQDRRSKDAVLNALAEVDYIYLHFPDPPPLPSENVGFVKRAVISAEKFLTIIDKMLGILG